MRIEASGERPSMPHDAGYSEYDCDLCASDDAMEIPCARLYTGDQPVHVCKNCGFVYVRRRRSARAIAEDWSNNLFTEERALTTETYSARVPAIKARQMFLADTIDVTIGLGGKRVCDIGAGEGQFLEIIRAPDYGAEPFGIEPSPDLCRDLSRNRIDNFRGTIEDYVDSGECKEQFDVVTIMWTLECSPDCKLMLRGAYDLLREGGHVLVATGSRILVPFKKPLQFYLDPKPLDTHPLRFSANTLRGLLAVCGFEPLFVNRYIDQDWLCVIARKAEDGCQIPWEGDDYREVLEFFERWHKESQRFYADYVDE